MNVNLGLCKFGSVLIWVQFCVNLSCVNLGMPMEGCVNLVLCKSDMCKFGFV